MNPRRGQEQAEQSSKPTLLHRHEEVPPGSKASQSRFSLRPIASDWRVFSVAGSVIAFAVTTLLMWYSFDRTLKSTERIALVSLSRDLSREFREIKSCSDILTLVNACEPVYESNGGELDYYKINECLNFFDDVAYLVESGSLTLGLADNLFGAAILEVTLTPELEEYVESVAANEKGAFANLKALSQRLQRLDRHRDLVLKIKTPCR